MKTTALLLSVLLGIAAGAAGAQPRAMKVDVVAVESIDDFQSWLQRAIAADQQGMPMPEGYPPSLKSIPVGKKVHFPILVGNLHPPAQGVVELVADLELLGPDGKAISVQQHCCSFRIENRPDYRTVMLAPTVNMTMDPGDVQGTYTVRVTVTDGTRNAGATETIRLGEEPGPSQRAPDNAAAPRLRMAPPAKNPGGDVDKRDCLSLPTPSEVIRCTERK